MAAKTKLKYGTGTVYLRGRIWWISYWVDGKQVPESSKSEVKAQAQQLLRERIATHRDKGIAVKKHVDVSRLLDLVIDSYEDRYAGITPDPTARKYNSLSWCRNTIETHLRPFFGYLQAMSLGTQIVRNYIEHRRSMGKQERGVKTANSTLNGELALLRRGYSLGVKHEPQLVPYVPNIPRLEVQNTREGFFEYDQFLNVLDHLAPDLHYPARWAYFTGMRRSEILQLRWSQVSLARRIVRLEPGRTKNREAREVPMNDEMFDMFTELWGMRDDDDKEGEFVFIWHGGYGHSARKGHRIRKFYQSWNTACKAAGVEGKIFHDFRRTAVRNLIECGVSEKVARSISGHKSSSVFDRYNIHNPALAQQAMEKVGEHVANQRKALLKAKRRRKAA